MQTHDISLDTLFAQLDECAPAVVAGAPLWAMMRTSVGYQVTVHLPNSMAGHPLTTTGGDITWTQADAATVAEAVAEAVAQVRAILADHAAVAA
ncbi:hypothetical protein [Nocardia niigatensis]